MAGPTVSSAVPGESEWLREEYRAILKLHREKVEPLTMISLTSPGIPLESHQLAVIEEYKQRVIEYQKRSCGYGAKGQTECVACNPTKEDPTNSVNPSHQSPPASNHARDGGRTSVPTSSSVLAPTLPTTQHSDSFPHQHRNPTSSQIRRLSSPIMNPPVVPSSTSTSLNISQLSLPAPDVPRPLPTAVAPELCSVSSLRNPSGRLAYGSSSRRHPYDLPPTSTSLLIQIMNQVKTMIQANTEVPVESLVTILGVLKALSQASDHFKRPETTSGSTQNSTSDIYKANETQLAAFQKELANLRKETKTLKPLLLAITIQMEANAAAFREQMASLAKADESQMAAINALPETIANGSFLRMSKGLQDMADAFLVGEGVDEDTASPENVPAQKQVTDARQPITGSEQDVGASGSVSSPVGNEAGVQRGELQNSLLIPPPGNPIANRNSDSLPTAPNTHLDEYHSGSDALTAVDAPPSVQGKGDAVSMSPQSTPRKRKATSPASPRSEAERKRVKLEEESSDIPLCAY